MKQPRHDLAAILAGRTLGTYGAKQLSEEIAAYLLDEGRTGELDSLVRDIMQHRADHGILEVNARTAHPLTDNIRRDIEARIRALKPDAKQIVITETHDEAMVGGVKLELANEQLDLSIRATLNRFKQLTAVGKES